MLQAAMAYGVPFTDPPFKLKTYQYKISNTPQRATMANVSAMRRSGYCIRSLISVFSILAASRVPFIYVPDDGFKVGIIDIDVLNVVAVEQLLKSFLNADCIDVDGNGNLVFGFS